MNAIVPTKITAAAVPTGIPLVLGALLFLCPLQASLGAEMADRQSAGGLNVLLRLVPSRIVDDDQHRKETEKLHGRAPVWGNPYHVIASVLDEKSGKPLEDVDVRASVFVRKSKLAGTHKRLQPMLVDGRKAWGDFFNVPAADPFRIRLDIRRPPNESAVTMEFNYKQRPHFEPQGN